MDKKTKIQVSIIIPNWNGADLLEKCLPSIFFQTYKNFELIVVDNGSTDGSVEYIQKNYPTTQIIELQKNIGFSPAVNLGIKKAVGKYIVLINNDTELDKNCIHYLIKAVESQKSGFVAAKMLQFYDHSKIDSAGDYIDIVGHADNIGRDQKDSQEFNQPHELFLATGGGSLFIKELFDQVGLFDDDYFAYMEDVDLCLRAQLQGFKGWYEPKAVIYHIHKATSSKNRAFLEYVQFRNMTQTIIKDFPTALLAQNFNWLKILLVNLNTVGFLATQGYLMSALKAEWYILTHLPTLLHKRQQIQSKKSVTDEYIISNFRDKELKIPFTNLTMKQSNNLLS